MSDYSTASEVENQRIQIQRIVDSLHVALPAKVISFTPEPTPKVSVQPLIQLKITRGEEIQYLSLPPLQDLPVVIPYAHTIGLLITLPILPGDTGLVVVADRGIKNFISGSGTESPPPHSGDPSIVAPRAHNLADGIFIPGLSMDKEAIIDYNLDSIEIRDKVRKNYISLNNEGIIMTDGTAVFKMTGGRVTIDTPQEIWLNGNNIEVGSTSNTFEYSVFSRSGTFLDKNLVSLNTHIHGGVDSGDSTTAPPEK